MKLSDFVSHRDGHGSDSKLAYLGGCGVASFVVVFMTVRGSLPIEFFMMYLGLIVGRSGWSKYMETRNGPGKPGAGGGQ